MRKVTSFIKPSNINMVTYRYNILDKVKEIIMPDLDLYQFGVYSGNSMISILNTYNINNINYKTFWGLDSFCGIPKEEKEGLRKPEWGEGEFSSLDYLDIQDVNLASKMIKDIVLKHHPESNLEMIVGFYSNLKFNEKMLPASYIDIDCDIYSSTIDALTFMYENKLIIKGSIINYDDWEGSSFGEGRAHIELCEKYSASFKKISDKHHLYLCENI